MDLTEKQKRAITILNEEKSISIKGSGVSYKTMDDLHIKNLVTFRTYSNGTFYTLSKMKELTSLIELQSSNILNQKSVINLYDYLLMAS